MIHAKRCIVFLWLCLFIPLASHARHKAIVIVPVADLVGQPMKKFYPRQAIDQSYSALPLCGAGTFVQAGQICPRIHQLLFNEIVEVLVERDDEVQIRVPQIFYCTHADNEKHNIFWTAKNNLVSLHTLQQHKIDTSFIPQPISAHTKTIISKKIVTLTEPYSDFKTKLTFSAGTRFVYEPHKTTPSKIAAYLIHPHTYKISLIYIPRKKCILYSQNKQEQKDTFVATLKNWAQQKKYAIPYVWGGCSFTSHKPMHTFAQQQRTLPNKKAYSYYALPHDTQYPKAGLDCAGMITRAAQLSGLPYFCKNTTTALKTLQPLDKTDTIQAGDIIYIPGHVIVISDVENNLIIEARGYDHGYGKVHEIPLSHQFKGINTYADLQNAYHAHTPIERLDKKGNVVQTINNLTILKLDSIWE